MAFNSPLQNTKNYYVNIAKGTTNLRRGVLKDHLTASKIHSTSFRAIPRKSENVLWDSVRRSQPFHARRQGTKDTLGGPKKGRQRRNFFDCDKGT